MKRFDIVTALLVLAGKIQQRRLKRAQSRVAALYASISAATEALPAAQRLVARERTINGNIALAK